MNKAWSVPALLLTFLMSAPSIKAQDVVYPGSTAQGDILRGQGQFLKGAAWYEINAARAREIDAKTAIEQERWNREVYESYGRELAVAAGDGAITDIVDGMQSVIPLFSPPNRVFSSLDEWQATIIRAELKVELARKDKANGTLTAG